MSVCLKWGATGKAACAVDARRLMYHIAIVSSTLGLFSSRTTLQQAHTEIHYRRLQLSQGLPAPFDV